MGWDGGKRDEGWKEGWREGEREERERERGEGGLGLEIGDGRGDEVG